MAWGRPPAKDRVVAMRSVAVLLIAEDSEKEIFVPELTDLNNAMGQEAVAVLATVPGLHEDMRESEGCMRSCLSAFRKPVG